MIIKKKIISSLAKTEIIDKDGNKISLDMFNYFTEKNIFFSKGKVEVLDVNNNKYSFSEIYIDEIKKKDGWIRCKGFFKFTGYNY